MHLRFFRGDTVRSLKLAGLIYLALLSCTPLLIGGCGSSDAGANAGTANATACAESDLIAQCPPNTMADLSIDASSVCSMSGSIDVSQGTDNLGGNAGAAVSTACAGSGTCRVVCRLLTECTYGVSRVSPTEGIICAEPPEGCGNGICDRGESPTICPIDCANDCISGETRCVGDELQTCTPRGVWDAPTACPSGERCVDDSGPASCGQSSCGDGVLDENEECEPSLSEDGECDPNCTRPRCGNGFRGLDVNGAAEECDDGNSDNTDNCTTICQQSRCGDGYLQDGEVCDDGNMVDTDGCRNTCVEPACGDGIVQPGEQCDDGDRDDTNECNNRCESAACGDGVVQADLGEQCDDGNGIDSDACTNSCQNARCGDGRIYEGREECDDNGFTGEGDACDDQCRVIECGNGRVDTGEVCDDGPRNAATGRCLPSCQLNQCGDGFVLDGVEECDDSNQIDHDACTNACTNARCGDGIEQRGVEECDDGNRVDDDDCTNSCTTPACGDGVEQGDEACDDGNDDNNDGCLNDCTDPICGDEIIWDGEEGCDDGNEINTDQCTNACALATCGDRIRRTDISDPSADGFEYCDDGNVAEYDGCNSSCEQTESEPNDGYGRTADVIDFGRVVGVMEAGDERNPGYDTYRFTLDCGVEAGADCPPGGEINWQFRLSTPQALCAPGGFMNPCTVRNFQVIAACEGQCPPPPTLRATRNNRVGARVSTYITWTFTGGRAGTWEFQLQSFRDEAFDYVLEVTAN